MMPAALFGTYAMLYGKNFASSLLQTYGNILEHIDPLDLVSQTPLRCFGEEYQDKLVRYLNISLNMG